MAKVAPEVSLQAEVESAILSNRALDLTLSSEGGWIRAADALLCRGRLDLAGRLLQELSAQEQPSSWVSNMRLLLDRLPDADGPPFLDHVERDLQVVARPGATGVLLAFCGNKGRVGLPLPMIHRLLGRLPVSVVYLREPEAMHYLEGLPSFGPGLDAAVRGLARVVEQLGAQRVYCFGQSSGGYGAFRYALELGAEAVACTGAPFHLGEDFNLDLRQAKSAALVRARLPEAALDLRELYLGKGTRPRAHIVFGEHQWDDRIHAEHMAGLDGVTLRPIPGFGGHSVIAELVLRGELEGLLSELVA